MKLRKKIRLTFLSVAAFTLVGVNQAHAVTNTPPTIGAISNQATYVDQPNLDPLLPVILNVSDAETATDKLQLSVASSNPSLLPTNNVVFHFFDVNDNRWYMTVVPAFGQTGTVTATVTVSDGTNSASANFLLTVKPPPPGAARFATTNAIAIPDGGAATPYPSTVNVGGMSGTITNLSLTLSRITHQYIRDVHMLLVGPTGQGMLVFSKISEGPVTNVTATLTDSTTFHLPDGFELWSERFWPTTNSVPNNFFPAPAPLGPYGPVSFSNSFNGLPANGTWSLYVYDSTTTEHGSLAGWSLMIATTGGANAAPTISDIPDQSTTVNTAVTNAFTIGDAETPIGNLTLNGNSSNLTLVPTNNIVFGGSGSNRTVTVTPAPNQTGNATITVTVSDGTNTASDTFLLTVNLTNTPPTITGIAGQTINEDTSTAALGFTVGDAETAAGSLTVSGVSSNLALVPNGNLVFGGSGSNRTVTVTPAANQNGTTLITVTVNDGQLSMNRSTSFLVTVNPVNDPPTISSIGDQAIHTNGTTGPLGFTIGDIDTPVSSLVVSGASSNPILVPTNNIVFAGSGTNRTVTVTPAAGQAGSTLITLTVSDGSLSSNTSFVVTVCAGPCGLVAAYSFNAGTGTTVADASGSNNVGTITAGTWTNAGRYGSALVFDGTSARIAINDSASLRLTTGMTLEAWVRPTTVSSAWRDVIYKGDDNYYLEGTSTSGGAPATGGTFTPGPLYGPAGLTVNTWAHLAATYDGATMQLYVNGLLVASQAQTGAMATSSNPLQIGGDNIYGQYFEGTIDEVRLYNRALSVDEIQADMNTPIVDVTPNTAPTITSMGNQTVNEDTATAAIGFTVGDAETAAGSLTVSGVSSNLTLVPNGNVVFGGSGSNRTVTVTPAANQNGATLITVTVSDGSLSSNTSFLVTVNAVNDPPTISTIGDQVVNEDTVAGPIGFTVGDVDNAASSLIVGGVSSNQTLVPNGSVTFGGSGSNRTVTVTPAANQNGTTLITVTVSDGSLSSNATFLVTVNPVNDTPTITSIGGQVINEDSVAGPIGFIVGDVETPAGSLTVSGVSSNLTLVPNGNIVFGGSGSNRTVTVTPAANQNGTTLITVTVSDGSLSSNTSFLVTVNAVNDPPTISDLGDQSIFVNTATAAIPFIVNDVETDPGSLLLSGSSSNTNVVSAANIVFGGASSNRTVTVTPVANRIGTTTITVTVSDGVTNASDSFVLTVGSGQLTVTGITAANKVYDGTNNAVLNVAGATLVGVVGTPDLALNTSNATGAFADPNVGIGKVVQIAGLTLSGADAGNYVLMTQPTTNADITARPLTVTANSTNKSYGAAVAFAGTEFGTAGLTNGGTVTSVTLASVGATNAAAVGSYDITASAAVGSGLGNYDISYVNGTLDVVATQPVILSLTGAGTTNVVITWSAVNGITYRLQYMPDLTTTNWSDLAPDIGATGDTASATDTTGAVDQRFYRVKIVP